MQNKSDAQLLGEYAAQHSDPAFAEIVARHTDLVYSAALRQTGSPELAREIAQSVFTDLARKARTLAGTLSADASLAGWLFRGTRFAGLKWLRDDHRRQTRERQFMEHIDPASQAAAESAPDWERVAPVLDEAMAELGDADHEAVLLRYFKNQDFHAVGRALGVSDDTAQKRVSRAVERLREFFVKRGVTVGAQGLVVIAANAVQAAPVGLAATLTTASLASAAVGTGTTLTLLKFMAMKKLQLGIIGALAVAIPFFAVVVARQNAATIPASGQASQGVLLPPTDSFRLTVDEVVQSSDCRIVNLKIEALSAEMMEMQWQNGATGGVGLAPAIKGNGREGTVVLASMLCESKPICHTTTVLQGRVGGSHTSAPVSYDLAPDTKLESVVSVTVTNGVYKLDRPLVIGSRKGETMRLVVGSWNPGAQK
jgi:RNA polymerase sigma factor (sigma-70 family)